MQLSKKKVIVTGATRGIGKAIANAFCRGNYYVIGTSTTNVNASSTCCNEMFTVDFGDDKQIEDCAAFVYEQKADILINNAGINKIAPFVEIEPKDFQLIQKVNVFAPFRLCQAAVPAMRENKWGRIINISSIWGKISKEFRASYSASKFALDGLTAALAIEHARDGIIANCIAPGFTDTELTRSVLGDEGINKIVELVPARRMGTVEDIANFVLWLCSEENNYITGQNIAIDGGFTRA